MSHNPPDRPVAGTISLCCNGIILRYSLDLPLERFVSEINAISALVDVRRSLRNCFFHGPPAPRQFHANMFIVLPAVEPRSPPSFSFELFQMFPLHLVCSTHAVVLDTSVVFAGCVVC
jgi:hypothetical protein